MRREIQDKVNQLVREHKMLEAQTLYFKEMMEERKDLIRM